MATRSQIGIVLPNEKILSIYCHNNGYLSWVGKRLRDHYTTEGQVMDLISLGDLSSLGEATNLCFAYGRDRGDQGVDATMSATRKEFIELGHSRGVDFSYLFKNGDWYWMPKNGRNFRKLPIAITD